MPEDNNWSQIKNWKDRVIDMLDKPPRDVEDDIQTIREAIWAKKRFTKEQYKHIDKFFDNHGLKR